MCTIANLVAVQLIAHEPSLSPTDAMAKAKLACEAVGVDPNAIIPVVSTRTAEKRGGDPARVKPDRFLENHRAGVRYSEHPARSPMAMEQNKPRYCHLAAGGCGAKLPSDTPMYYQEEGPKPKLQKGQWKGREYGMTLEKDCYEKLQASLPKEDPAPPGTPSDEQGEFF